MKATYNILGLNAIGRCSGYIAIVKGFNPLKAHMTKLTKKEKKLLTKLLSKSKTVETETGLKWWTKRGFKVIERGLTFTSEDGKKYPAVKGVTKEGKELSLKATRGGAIFTSKEW